ncbi:MAG: hypothetical protein L0Z71_12355 [Anaerolineae bacterium]|nr:hypothetical protein [Anaerolineae bacterium]
MNALTRSLATFLSLSVLIACTSAPKPTETPKPSETAALTQAGVMQPTNQAQSPATALPQPTIIDSGHLSPALGMNTERAAHTATLLADGKVLIAGGFRKEVTSEVAIANAEIYDPETNTFTPTGDMNEARIGHTATLLSNGQVLIVGGWGVSGQTSTAELYDPQTGNFLYAASMVAPRAGMTTTLLKNGRVLIVGGESARNTPQLITEIYDPTTNTFTQSSSLNRGRLAHTATLLNDGNVLLVGGHSSNNTVLASAEIYNPTTGKFTYTGDLNMVRHKHAAVLLQDGTVLVIGGSNQNDWRGKYTSAEIYHVNTGTFTRIADLNRERFKLADAAVLLNNGNVLVGGGNRQMEIFDVQNQHFILSEKLDNDYYFSILTLLKDGRVLITGGYDSGIQPSDKAWVYN